VNPNAPNGAKLNVVVTLEDAEDVPELPLAFVA
jgi:hypothetical protein